MKSSRFKVTDHVIAFGLILAVSFWIIESAAHVIISRDRELINEIFNLDPHALCVRSIYFATIILFAFFVQYLISRQKRIEVELKVSEGKYRTFIETLTDIVFTLDTNGRFTYLNPLVQAVSGHRPEDLIGRSFLDILTPEIKELTLDRFKKGMAGEEIPLYEIKIFGADGRIIPMEISMKSMRGYSDTITGRIGVARDISERKNSEQALKESENKYRTILESIEEGYFELDLNGYFTFFNNSLSRILGYPKDDLLGMDFRALVPAATRRKISRIAKEIYHTGKQQEIINFEAIRGDGSIGTLEMSISLIRDHLENAMGFRGIVRDITDRKRLEAQLLQAQKMEAIGTLAGGIAHDFNNLLMAIQGNASLMSIGMDTDNAHYKRIRHIEQCVQSGSDLTRQLLGFARGGKYEIKPADINYIIQKTSEMFGQTRKEIHVHRKYQEDAWCIEADKGQIEQVLLNLYVNAWQAMPEGGDLYIESCNITLDENDVRTHDTKPGPYVRISVTDTGMGMDDKTMRRIFEPFFSTKDMSRGSGLGLASAYGIVKNHGGYITVSSKKDKGSTFHVNLPASEKIVSGEIKEGCQKILSGIETILMVDDETMIIEIGSELLKQLGYTVMAALGGKEALEIFTDHKDKIDLVILDMIMPGLGGSDTFDQIRQIRNDIKVILSSGYSLNGHAAKIMDKGCNGFIQKPFDIAAFSRKIREVLDSRP